MHLGLATVLASLATVYASLQNNIAYQSPAKRFALGHDTDAIHARLAKRATFNHGKYYNGKLTFPYGIASGDVETDSVILWTRPEPEKTTSQALCLKYLVSSSSDLKHLVSQGEAHTTTDIDYSYKVEAKGLKPSTKYYYRFDSCNGNSRSEVGSFKTIPDAKSSVGAVKLAVFSCSNLPFGFFNAYGNAARMGDIDYMLHLGDYIYEYKNGDYGNGSTIDPSRVPQPADRELSTLDDYRQRYKSYRRDLDLQLAHQKVAWIPVWDDHEVADNTWKNGSADSNNTAQGEVNGLRFTPRKANALKAYFEWMPIRQVDTSDNLRIWRTFQIGSLFDLIMLDTRHYNRDITDVYYNTPYVASISNDENRSMMGGKQEQWFYDQLLASQKRKAKWRIVGQQVVVGHLDYSKLEPSYVSDYDAWDGYKSNRRRILNHISDNKIDNTVFLSGDSHANWVFELPRDIDNLTKYDPETGNGSVAVEFAGTAVSSPSPLGQGKNTSYYTGASKVLVGSNPELKFSEGQYRGWFSLTVSPNKVSADYYSIPSLLKRSPDAIHLAHFEVASGQNRVSRSATRSIQSGALGYGFCTNSTAGCQSQ